MIRGTLFRTSSIAGAALSKAAVASSLSSAAAITASALMLGGTGTGARAFSTANQLLDERGELNRLSNISPIVGQPKPCTQEGDWQLRFPLTARMEGVIETLLRERGWSEAEITREVQNFLPRGGTVKQQRDRRSNWSTVEGYQRTPWYRRFRPNESCTMPMVSIECMKILEEVLIPPSARGDPYSHLRKRHYEDTFHNEKYSEGSVRQLTRSKLAAYTKGSPTYGARTRKEFIEFEQEYKKRMPGQYNQQNEAYNAWKGATID